MWFYIKKIFSESWNLICGIFMFSRQWRRQKKLVDDQDLHYHYKRRMQQTQEAWAVQEQRMIAEAKKRLPAKHRKNSAVYNYLTTCVYRLRPGMNMQEAIRGFYDQIHPHYFLYYEAYQDINKLLKAKDPRKLQESILPVWRKKYARTTDLPKRAEQMLEKYKVEAQKVGREEREHRRARQGKLDNVDKKHLKEDAALLKAKIEEDQRTLKIINREMRAAEKSGPRREV